MQDQLVLDTFARMVQDAHDLALRETVLRRTSERANEELRADIHRQHTTICDLRDKVRELEAKTPRVVTLEDIQVLLDAAASSDKIAMIQAFRAMLHGANLPTLADCKAFADRYMPYQSKAGGGFGSRPFGPR